MNVNHTVSDILAATLADCVQSGRELIELENRLAHLETIAPDLPPDALTELIGTLRTAIRRFVVALSDATEQLADLATTEQLPGLPVGDAAAGARN